MKVEQAYRFAMNPISAQVGKMWSHRRGAQSAYNAMPATVKANLDQRKAERYESGAEGESTPPRNWPTSWLEEERNRRTKSVTPWSCENSEPRPQATTQIQEELHQPPPPQHSQREDERS